MVESLTDQSRFLRACRREPVDATPIWLMRQAGRYMPEYRALRAKFGILDLIKQPDLACEITLQPIDAFSFDAAIIFADILTLIEAMGLHLEFQKGEGPVIHNPVRTLADAEALREVDPEEDLGFTLEAIRLTRRELDSRGIPLIGFSGAPYTLACYAVEGGSSRNHRLVKTMMMREPAIWDSLMRRLSDAAGQYLLAQARAGAQVLQLFDSWVGDLSAADYLQYVFPYTKRTLDIARQAGVPLIHFGVNNGHLLEAMRDAGGDVIGVDWRVHLGDAWERIGHDRAIQGNLDPISLFADPDTLERRARQVLDQAGGRPGHIFNLGHGVLQETPLDQVKRLVEIVHDASRVMT